MDIKIFNDYTEHKKESILSDYEEMNDVKYWIKRGSLILILVIATFMGGCPAYNVWEQGMEGKAELTRAEQNRQILINEAKAKEQSSVHWAKAEVERAKGAAEANQIVADSLGGPEGYLRWLFIEKLDDIKSGQIIYLPTEAGIPILEANRLK